MSASNTISPALFSLLDGVEPVNRIQANDKSLETILTLTRARDNLLAFTKNFFSQFFYEGYGIKIESFDGLTSSQIEHHFEKSGSQPGISDKHYNRPNSVISVLRQYIAVQDDLMGAKYTIESESVRDAYRVLLPKLFSAFREDGRVVSNYEEVLELIGKAGLAH